MDNCHSPMGTKDEGVEEGCSTDSSVKRATCRENPSIGTQTAEDDNAGRDATAEAANLAASSARRCGRDNDDTQVKMEQILYELQSLKRQIQSFNSNNTPLENTMSTQTALDTNGVLVAESSRLATNINRPMDALKGVGAHSREPSDSSVNQMASDLLDEKDKFLWDDMKRELRTKYKQRYTRLKPLRWRQDIRFPTECFRRNIAQQSSINIKKDIKLTEFLQTSPSEPDDVPKRIILEGPIGYGKSIVARKLANMWAKEHQFLAERFELVFLLDGNSLDGKDIERYLTEPGCMFSKDLFRRHDVRGEDVWSCILRNQEKVLFIIDIKKDQIQSSIIDLFLGKFFLSSTAILATWPKNPTARQLKYDRKLSILKHKRSEIYDHIYEFFTEMEQTEVGYKLLKKLQLTCPGDAENNPQLHLLTVPNMLIYVCVLWYDNDNNFQDNFERLDPMEPQIYKTLFEITIRNYHSEKRAGNGKQENANVLDIYEEDINFLGELAYNNCLGNSCLYFGEDQLQGHHTLGFVRRETVTCKTATRTRYEFDDPIWMIYLAARHIKMRQIDVDDSQNGVVDRVRCFADGADFLDKFLSSEFD